MIGFMIGVVLLAFLFPWALAVIIPVWTVYLIWAIRHRRQLGHRTLRFASEDQRAAVWRAYAGRCAHCGTTCVPSLEPRPDRGEIDHIVPWSRGGETVLGNLQLLCSFCNQEKSNRYVG